MTPGLSRREFAKLIGCSVGWVQKLVETGRCVLTADGKIDGPASRARVAATADPGRQDVADRHAEARRAAGKPSAAPNIGAAAPNIPTEAPNIDAGLGVEAGVRAKAKALLMHYENSSLKLEMALRRGLRFERAAVKREAASLGAMLRAGIERVIDQTAPRLAAAGNELDRRQIIDQEIRRLRSMIKREMPRAMRRMRTDLQKKPENAA